MSTEDSRHPHAAPRWISCPVLAPFEEFLARQAEHPTPIGNSLNSLPSQPEAVLHSSNLDATSSMGGLSPQQLALLVLQLRKKKAVSTNGNGSRPVAIKRSSRKDELPLSFAQQRLWFLHQLEPNSTAYHIASSIRLSGPLNIAALKRALDEIIRRHEIRRTTFSSVNGLPRQVISSAAAINLPLVDLETSRLQTGKQKQEASPKNSPEDSSIWRLAR